jgi:hypothetical protein
MSERNSAVQAPKHAGWSLIEADMPAVRRSSVWVCVRPRETEAAGVPDAICITRPVSVADAAEGLSSGHNRGWLLL